MILIISKIKNELIYVMGEAPNNMYYDKEVIDVIELPEDECLKYLKDGDIVTTTEDEERFHKLMSKAK
jgi:hypothetical protein